MIDRLVVSLLSAPHLRHARLSAIVIRIALQRLAIVSFSFRQIAETQKIGAKLPLRPGNAFRWLLCSLTRGDGLLEFSDRARGISMDALESRQAAARVEAIVQLHHFP